MLLGRDLAIWESDGYSAAVPYLIRYPPTRCFSEGRGDRGDIPLRAPPPIGFKASDQRSAWIAMSTKVRKTRGARLGVPWNAASATKTCTTRQDAGDPL